MNSILGLDAPGVRRMITLAEKPSPGMMVNVDGRALTALMYGADPGEAERGRMNVDERMPLLARADRIRDDLEAARLQISYRTIQTGFARRTDSSRRLGLLDWGASADDTGVLRVTVCGLLAGYSRADWRMGGILLTSPAIIDENGSGRIVDSHLWLDVRNLQPGLLEDGITVRDMRIGDVLTVTGRLNGYSDANGLRRLGLGEWAPLSARLVYACGRDAHPRLVTVPRHLKPHMIVARFRDGEAEWADPYALDVEIREWEERYPESSTGLRLGGARAIRNG